MKSTERRLRALEAAVGREEDTSWHGQVRRMHARGENIPVIIVEPGETAEEVREREGIPDWMPYIAHIIVEPGTEAAEEAAAAAEPAIPPADALEANPQDSDFKPKTRDSLPNGDRNSDDREDRYEPRQDPWM